jgi:hypothetical protein
VLVLLLLLTSVLSLLLLLLLSLASLLLVLLDVLSLSWVFCGTCIPAVTGSRLACCLSPACPAVLLPGMASSGSVCPGLRPPSASVPSALPASPLRLLSGVALPAWSPVCGSMPLPELLLPVVVSEPLLLLISGRLLLCDPLLVVWSSLALLLLSLVLLLLLMSPLLMAPTVPAPGRGTEGPWPSSRGLVAGAWVPPPVVSRPPALSLWPSTAGAWGAVEASFEWDRMRAA